MKTRCGILKILAVIVPAMLLAVLFWSNTAQAQANIGVVDLRAVAEKHPVYMQWDKDLEKMKAERQSQVEKFIMQKYNLPENVDPSTLSDQQKTEIQQILYEENQKFLQEMEPMRDQKLQEVEKDIQSAIEKVASSKGLTVVLDSAVVLLGGTNITQDVMALVAQITPPAPTPPAPDNK